MDAYIYQAALYCEDCGEKIKRKLGRAEDTGDSGDYPQGPYSDGGGEADGPQHCENHERCVNAEHLKWKGCGVGKVGAFLKNPLTRDGVEYLCEMVSESGSSDFQKALHKLWLTYYRREGYAAEISKCIREQVRSR